MDLATGMALLTLLGAVIPFTFLYKNRKDPGTIWMLWLCVAVAVYPLDVLLQLDLSGVRHRMATIALLAPLYFLAMVEYLRAEPNHWSLIKKALLFYMACVFVAPWLPGDWYMRVSDTPADAQYAGVLYEFATGSWAMKVISYGLVFIAAQMVFRRMGSAVQARSYVLNFAFLPLLLALADLVASVISVRPYTGISAVQVVVSVALFVLSYALVRKKVQVDAPVPSAPVPRSVLMSRMREGVCVINNGGVIVDCNSPLSAMIGIPEGKLVGRQAKHVLPEALLSQLDARRETGVVRDARLRLESVNLWVTVNVEKLDESDSESSVLLAVTDVTDQVNELQHLEATTDELTEANQRLAELSNTDPLTGLGNRRELRHALIARNDEAPDESAGLVMIGVDQLKAISETHGLKAGDAVLVGLAGSMKEICRDSDTLVRWDGGQFVLLLRSADEDRLQQAAERLRQQIRRLVIALDNGISLQVTVSIGGALMEPGQSTDSALEEVDRLLLEARQKDQGRANSDG